MMHRAVEQLFQNHTAGEPGTEPGSEPKQLTPEPVLINNTVIVAFSLCNDHMDNSLINEKTQVLRLLSGHNYMLGKKGA